MTKEKIQKVINEIVEIDRTYSNPDYVSKMLEEKPDEIDPKLIKYFDEDICEKLVAINPDYLQFIPPQMQTMELVKEAMRRTRSATLLKHVRGDLRTKEICEIASQKDGLVLEHMPSYARSEDVIIRETKKHFLGILDVYSDTTDKALKEMAKLGEFLPYIDTRKHNAYKLYLLMVKSSSSRDILREVPIKFRDRNMCLEAIKSNAYNIVHVPYKEKTYDLCYKAVQLNGYVLSEIPQRFHNEELYLAAVGRYGYGEALKYVLEQTPKIAATAIKNDMSDVAWQYVRLPQEEDEQKRFLREMSEEGVDATTIMKIFEFHKRWSDPEYCMEQIKRKHYGEQIAFAKVQTPEMCEYAVKESGYNIRFIKNPSYELCVLAVTNPVNGNCMHYLDESMFSKEIKMRHIEICGISDVFMQDYDMALLGAEGGSLTDIDTKYWTKEVCEKTGDITIMPYEHRDEDVLESIVARYPYKLSHIPFDLRSERLYFAALQRDGYSKEDIFWSIPPEERSEEMLEELLRSARVYSATSGVALLTYVHNQTPRLCAAALQNEAALAKYVRLPSDPDEKEIFLQELVSLLSDGTLKLKHKWDTFEVVERTNKKKRMNAFKM